MKKLLFGLILTLVAGGLMSWQWEKIQLNTINKA